MNLYGCVQMSISEAKVELWLTFIYHVFNIYFELAAILFLYFFVDRTFIFSFNLFVLFVTEKDLLGLATRMPYLYMR